MAVWDSPLPPGCKPVQLVTLLNTIGNCNTIVFVYLNININLSKHKKGTVKIQYKRLCVDAHVGREGRHLWERNRLQEKGRKMGAREEEKGEKARADIERDPER